MKKMIEDILTKQKTDWKLIALDIDGTMINSRHELTATTRKAVKAAITAGINVTIATGRHYNSAVHLAKEVGINTPMVCHDGALIAEASTGKILSAHLLPLEIAKGALNIAKKYDSLIIQIFNPKDKVYAGRNYHIDMARHFIKSPRPYTLRGLYNYFRGFVFVPVKNAGDIEKAKKTMVDSPAKVLVCGDSGQLQAFIKEIKGAYGQDISLTTALVDCIDILGKGVSKAKGLAELTKILDIKPSQVIAVGDHINDLEMLKFAGVGVAMGNALEQVQEQADCVTKSNDQDGVAYLIGKILDQKRPEKC